MFSSANLLSMGKINIKRKAGPALLMKGKNQHYETSQYTGSPGGHDRKPLDR